MTYDEIRKICDSMWQADLLNADIQKVMEALEKQKLPKKPKHEHLNFYCASCGNWLLWDDAEPNEHDLFCSKCGQKIDWSEVE